MRAFKQFLTPDCQNELLTPDCQNEQCKHGKTVHLETENYVRINQAMLGQLKVGYYHMDCYFFMLGYTRAQTWDGSSASYKSKKKQKTVKRRI
jgi:hypothetical protein